MAHARLCGLEVCILLLVKVCLVWTTYLYGGDSATGVPVKNDAFHSFATYLGQSQMDLVILIERSESVGHYTSYRAQALVNKVLRYYTKVDPEYIRVALGTFAMDFKVHFDGITRNVSKCDIWDTYWDQREPEDTKGIWESANVSLAIQQTVALFERTSGLTSRPRYLWVMCENNTGAEFSQNVTNHAITLLFTTFGGGQTVLIPHDQYVYYTGDVLHTAAVLGTIRPLQPLSQFRSINNTHYCDAYGHTIGTCEGCLYRQEWVGHHVPSRIYLKLNVSSVMSWPVTTIDHECRLDEGDCVCATTKATHPCLAPVSYVERSLPFEAQEVGSVYWTLAGGLCCIILVCLQCIICIIPREQLEPGTTGTEPLNDAVISPSRHS